jgi:hypothetical protein
LVIPDADSAGVWAAAMPALSGSARAEALKTRNAKPGGWQNLSTT